MADENMNKIDSFKAIETDQDGNIISTKDVALTTDWTDVNVKEFGGTNSLKDLLLLKKDTDNQYFLINTNGTLSKSIMQYIVDNHEELKKRLFGIRDSEASFIDGIYNNAVSGTNTHNWEIIKNNLKLKGYTLTEVTIGGNKYYYPVPTTGEYEIDADYAKVLSTQINDGSLFQNLLEQSYWWTNAMGEPFGENTNSIVSTQEIDNMFSFWVIQKEDVNNE